MKSIKKINLVLLSTVLVLSACSKKEDSKEEKQENKNNFVEKQTKYKKDNTTEVLVDKELKKEDVLRSFKHGDHWHVFTKDGKEHIVYTDPTKLSSGETLNLVSVVSNDKLAKLNVVAIKQHGDHWHVYTADGKEVLTYNNPTALYPHISIGTYTGSHEEQPTARTINTTTNTTNVIAIKKHGDHWHIYTAAGEEFISYTDPSAQYPGIIIGNYEGSHSGEHHADTNTKINVETNSTNHFINKPATEVEKINTKPNTQATNNFTIIPVLGKEKVNRNDIVKILRHGDHYHIYDSKGNEGLTYANPQQYYPNAEIGEYTGEHETAEKHNHKEHDNHSSSSENTPKIEWPTGVTKIIDHGDHWHLFIGEQEIAVVHENPKKHYPNAEIIKEESEETSNVTISADELFKYEDVTEKLIASVFPYLSENLKAMDSFGTLVTNKPVYGSDGQKENIFYWLHGDHYHAITINQIIKKAKNGDFGTNTARDVVAVLKYKVNHPGIELEFRPTVDFEEIRTYLLKYYKLTGKTDVMLIDNNVTIYKNNESRVINISKFDKKDNQIIVLEALPEFPEKENAKSEEEVAKEREENNNLINKLLNKKPSTSRENETPKLDEAIASAKEKENIANIAKILAVTEEEAEELIFDIIPETFRLAELEIDEAGIATLKGKKYKIQKPVEEDEE